MKKRAQRNAFFRRSSLLIIALSLNCFQTNLMSIPLERLFGSRTRAKLLTLFTNGVRRPYYVRELTRITKERVNSIRREVENLKRIGLLVSNVRNGKKYYAVNPKFPVFPELCALMVKIGKPLEDRLFEGVKRLGKVRLFVLTGVFTQAHRSPTDLLIVGDIKEASLKAFITNVEEEVDREINYTVMSVNEYEYRKHSNDNFLREIFSSPHVELLNTVDPGERQPQETEKQEEPAESA